MKRILAVLVSALTLVSAHPASATAVKAGSVRTISIHVTRNGFEPNLVHLEAGRPVRLVVTRTVERTCAKDFVIKDLGIRKALPLGTPITVAFTPTKTGSIRYACAMDMVAGKLMVE